MALSLNTNLQQHYSYSIMGRAFAVAIVTALNLLLLLLHAFPCAAARPLSKTAVSSEKSALALAPSAASEGTRWRAADAAARAGKWLPYPFTGGLVHYPGYSRNPGYPEAKPMMWAAGVPPALGLGAFGTGAGGQLGKAPPYVDITQQEQVAMWASLLNPSQRPTTPTTWLPANGGELAEAHDEPKALVVAEGTEMDVPAGGGGVQTSLPMVRALPGEQ